MATADNIGYSIWGVDNVVYGPVELPVLINWVTEERVTGDTWVFRHNETSWDKAGAIPELQSLFGMARGERAMTAYDTELTSRNPSIKPGSLRRIKIFSAMSDEQLASFVRYLEVKTFRAFSEIVRQGEPGDSMYFVIEGEARVRLMIAGRESILTTLSTGEFFGEISLFDHGPRSADVVANSDVVLLKLSASACQKLADSEPELATPFLLAMSRTMTARIRADNKRFRDTVAITRGSFN